MATGYPVGAAQSIVLKALGETASTFQEAERVFETYRLRVTSKRVGRTSVPEVKERGNFEGAFNRYGEGETWTVECKPLTAEQRAALEQYFIR